MVITQILIALLIWNAHWFVRVFSDAEVTAALTAVA